MKTIELFSGTKSFSKVAKKLGYNTITIDNNKNLNPDFCLDILKIINFETFKDFDILWASPPCETFSVASISSNWTGGIKAYIPKTDRSRIGLALLDKTIEIISKTKPNYWFIENPRGVMRKVIDEIFKKYNITDYVRNTITYCQYGDTRMKPTDIWTNFKEWKPRQMCHNEDKCHESAPRGSKTGTQGLKNATERGVIPPTLFEEIFNSIRVPSTPQETVSPPLH